MIKKLSFFNSLVNKSNFSLIRNVTTVQHADSDFVIVTKQKKLFLIGINRPGKRNCVNKETALQLQKAFENFENDEDAYAAVLYGKGGNFCAGYDLEEVSKGKFEGISFKTGPMGPTKHFLKKPVIAAINGYAVGGGFELALWCDLRVVEDTAIMGCFNRRFGVPNIDGGNVRLPQIVGLGRALDLILTGRALKAREAFEMGLVTKITACGTAIGNAINLANSLCKFPQDCLKFDRHSIYHSLAESNSLKEALNFELEKAQDIVTNEAIEGAKKFMQGVGKHGTFHLDFIEKDD